MSFKTFNLNDMVFIENIGYGTLIDCNSHKKVAIKQSPVAGEKKQSIYFDPDLFTSEGDSFERKISQTRIVSPQIDNKLEQINSQTKLQSIIPITIGPEKNASEQGNDSLSKESQINIVKVRLQGTKFIVYTPDKNIRKYVIIPVRPFFAPAIGTLNIRIEINQTIESFKREIFELLGLKHAHYYNVKIFTTSPHLTQLNSPGKTIWQYGIRQSSTLTMTAEHGFCFETVPQNLGQYFSVVNNNLSFVSLPKKLKVAQNIVIALPPPQIQSQLNVQTPANPPTNITNNSPAKKNQVPKEDGNKRQPLPQPGKQKQQPKPADNGKQIAQKPNDSTIITIQQDKQTAKVTDQSAIQSEQKSKMQQQSIIPETLQIKADKVVKSGKHYFQVRLDKLPSNNAHLKIGVKTESGDRKWWFSPLSQQKIFEQNNEIKSSQPYGIVYKQNDTIGVLVNIDKQKIMKLNFFKNNIGLGICFQAKIEEVQFVFVIGSEGQISLDTRNQPPIDSYRFR